MRINGGHAGMSDLHRFSVDGIPPSELVSAFAPGGYADAAQPEPFSQHAEPLCGEALLKDCLRRITRGDEEALAVLYDETAARVHAAAMRILRSEAAASEVVSDVYFQVWRNAGSFDATRGSVGTWLLVICRSRALDRLRQRDPAVLHPDPYQLAAEASGNDDPQDLVSALQSGALIREGLLRLAPLHRQVVALAFFRGFTQSEIAEHMDLTLGTVKSMLRQSMQSLRSFLEPAGRGGLHGND